MGFELILGCLIFSGMVMTTARAIGDAITTAKAAKAGEWDFLDKDRDRRANRWGRAWEATRRRRHQDAGGSGSYQPGLGAYLGDVYHGWCQDLIDKRRSKREQRGPAVYNPDRKPWHQRVDDAAFAIADKAKRAWRNRGNQTPSPTQPKPVAIPVRMTCQYCGKSKTFTDPVAAEMVHNVHEHECPDNPNNQTPTPAEPEGDQEMPEKHDGPPMSMGELGMRRAGMPPNGDPTSGSTGGASATGDAHDVESALHQCDLLDDDLTRIDTSLDVIDEAIASAGNAAELIEAFLASKNVDDAAVGGMSVARDMLSPTHIKALIDAIATAKNGVAQTREELLRLQDVEQQLHGADGSVLNGR